MAFAVLVALSVQPGRGMASEPEARPGPPTRAEPQRVLWDDGVKYAYPHWSKDGSRILYQSNRGGTWQIHVMTRDGLHGEQLTQGPSNSNFPDWSPDNAAIAFVSDRDGNEEVYVMKADGSSLVNLSNNPGRDIHPYWSSDGKTILFSSTRDGSKFQIYEVTPGEKVVRRLVTSGDDDTCARVSPKGDRIVYLTNLSAGRDDIIVRSRDGSGPANVTDDEPEDGWPAWTPDGNHIVFSSRRTGPFSLFVMKSDGSQQQQISFPSADYFDGRANVSPDGKRIVFNRERGETIGIFVVDLELAASTTVG